METAENMLDEIAVRLVSAMTTYKENATEDAPRMLEALNAVLSRADRMAATKGESERAYALREAADDIRAEIAEALSKSPIQDRPERWDDASYARVLDVDHFDWRGW